MKPKGKILVIRGGAIGDFILTLPVLSALRRKYPDAHIEVLGYPHIAMLAQAGGLAQAVRSIDSRGLARFFTRDAQLDLDLVCYFAGFDLILSYLYDPAGVFRENVERCGQTRYIQGPHRPDDTGHQHATEVLLKPLEQLAVFNADAEPHLRINPEWAAPYRGRWLACHPGSGSETKNWPETQWATLLHRVLEETAWKILLVGGEAEGQRLERLAVSWPPDRLCVARHLPLPQLAERLSGCTAFVGHDSGISHLAAAVGLSGLVLWGHTNETVWRPRSKQVRILREPAGLAHLQVGTVFAALLQLVEQPRTFAVA
ncbi:MAG: glycosyltransferase family 9 protein [Verrucomicrobiota bacterium]